MTAALPVVIEPIESGVPLPLVGRKRKYPFHDLEVGQSFRIGCPQVELQRLLNSITSCGRLAVKRSGKKFAIRAVKGGIRVWRTA